MDYIRITVGFADGEVEAYQEIDGGVVGHKALDGTFLFVTIPAGVPSWVTDAAPARESWML